MPEDHGVPDWAGFCPLCAGPVNLYSVDKEMGTTYFMRCKNMACIFGDTKTITWMKSLERVFNNRTVDFGRCVAKECDDVVVVRASHLCRHHEKEYL